MKHFAKVSVVVAGFLVQGCAGKEIASLLYDTKMERSTTKIDGHRACVVNYSSEGNFFTGKQFKTFEDFPNISKDHAFDRLLAKISSDGFQIENSNKESGIISANQAVTGGQGKTVPLNALVKSNSSGGIRIELVFTLSGGLITSADGVQDQFCEILASVTK